MKYISASQYHGPVLKICEKKGHKFRTNKFGVTWCTRCGCLGPWTIDEPIKEEDKFIVVPDGDPRLELRPPTILGIDFDSTLCKEKWPEIGENVPGAFEVCRELQKYGHKIILLTQREHVPIAGIPDVLQAALDKCKEEGLKLYSVNDFPEADNQYFPSRKVYADFYIDDHGVGMPLIREEGQTPYVDWVALDKWFAENKFYLGNVLKDG